VAETEAEAENREVEAKTEAKILASRPRHPCVLT